jgi:hypothetical protein
MVRSYQFNFPFTFKKTKIIKIFFVNHIKKLLKILNFNYLKIIHIHILFLFKL